MSENKHTPGPWTVGHFVDGDEDGQGCGLYEVEEAHYAILETRREMRGSGLDEADANARLIAAAPDLLETLRRLADELENGRGPLLTTGEEKRLKAARAAIAKATEEQNG